MSRFVQITPEHAIDVSLFGDIQINTSDGDFTNIDYYDMIRLTVEWINSLSYDQQIIVFTALNVIASSKGK